MKICVAGQGAFGQKHLDALKRIQGVEVTSLVGGNQDSTAAIAKKYGIATPYTSYLIVPDAAMPVVNFGQATGNLPKAVAAKGSSPNKAPARTCLFPLRALGSRLR